MGHYLAGIALKPTFYSLINNCLSMICNAFVNELFINTF